MGRQRHTPLVTSSFCATSIGKDSQTRDHSLNANTSPLVSTATMYRIHVVGFTATATCFTFNSFLMISSCLRGSPRLVHLQQRASVFLLPAQVPSRPGCCEQQYRSNDAES